MTAYEAMSSLVNYIQPNKFVSFDIAKSKKTHNAKLFITSHAATVE